jgi:hypothetical protein
MRNTATAWVTCAAVLLLPAASLAQVPMRVQIDKVQIGFQPYSPQDEFRGRFKAGLWAPVYVTFAHKPDGPIFLSTGKDGLGRGELLVETTDSDDVGNIYRVPLALAANDTRPVLTYIKPAVERPAIRIGVASGGQSFTPLDNDRTALELGEHLYLTLGARLSHFHDALLAMAPARAREDRETRPRQAAYENDIQHLPTEWFGYDAVDLMILTTDNTPFLDKLGTDRTRTKALAEWVRRGGRLVVSVAWRNQDKVRALLQSGAWQPALPDLLTANDHYEIDQLLGVRTWVAPAREKPFPGPGQEPVRVAKLTPGRDAEVLVSERNKEPIIIRVPYGLGNVTLVALDLDKGPFSVWTGRVDFWKVLLEKLAPKVFVPQDDARGMANQLLMDASTDVATRLQRDLDRFDVAVISFGWVALFILLYILVVGPLDYLILKKVFKRLEWTWITFPSVVLIVSGVAYFTAYAVKGSDLKINKVDLIDLDMRSDLDGQQQPRRAYAYGTTWFTILSPRIQNYTVGIGPDTPQGGKKADLEPAGVLVSWMGRPENAGMGGMGRQRSQGLFRRAYDYAPDGAGLTGVPIPVWSTKTFTASWEAALAKLPFRVDLRYNPNDPEQFSGTIQSKLPIALEDVWIYYGGQWFPPAGERAPDRQPIWKVSSDPAGALKLDAWVGAGGQGRNQQINAPSNRRDYDPTPAIKELLFAQRSPYNAERNHGFRRLDASWRLSSERWQGPGVTREAILFARLPRTTEQATPDAPSSIDPALWLGELPGEGKALPPLPGSLIQDTYLRVYLPVTPAQP